MPTRQGNLLDYGGNKIAPNTLTSAVYDAARSQALSASLIALIEHNALGYPAFSTAVPYAVGDIVFHDRQLWKFTAAHTGAWDAGDVDNYPMRAIMADLVSALCDGTIIPALAENLSSWASRRTTVRDTWTGTGRTTAGDVSIDSSVAARVFSIVPKSNYFYASAIKTTGFNLLHDAVAVGAGYYFFVPALPFGTFGTAEHPNGVLFTNSAHENMRPTVYFKALADGVPTGVTDGSPCAYTDSGGYRFYTTAQAGWLIVSGFTYADTCAHIAWSSRYDEYISPAAGGDAGTSRSLTAALSAVHSTAPGLYSIGDVADRLDWLATGSTLTWTRRVSWSATPAWATVQNEDGSYTHSVTLSDMMPDGAAYLEGVTLTVDGRTVSYTDSSADAAAGALYFELAESATGTVTLAQTLTAEDWGLEMLVGAVGDAYVTMQYSQNYPDNLAALVAGVLDAKLRVLTEAIAQNGRSIRGLIEGLGVFGDIDAADVSYRGELKRNGIPLILYAPGVPSAALVPTNWDAATMGEWTGAPHFVGQHYVNTDADNEITKHEYVAIGTTVEGWV